MSGSEYMLNEMDGWMGVENHSPFFSSQLLTPLFHLPTGTETG